MRLRTVLRPSLPLTAVIAFTLGTSSFFGQTESASAPAAAAASIAHPEEYLRAAYYRGDRDIILRDGAALAAAKGASLETRAWYAVAGLDRVIYLNPEGLEMLDSMRADAPDDPWTLVTRSYAAGDVDWSAALCEKAWAKDSREDLVVLCAAGIAYQARTEADTKRLRDFFERNKNRYEASAKTLTAEAEAIQIPAFWVHDSKALDEAAVLFDRALATDPHNIRALLGKYRCMALKHPDREQLALLEAAAPWAKESQEWHQGYYHILNSLDELKKPERVKQVEADWRELIERSEPGNELLSFLVYALYKASAPNSAAEMIDLVLKKYPNTPAGETALLYKATEKFGADSSGEKATPEVRQEVIANVLALLDRPGPKGHEFEMEAAGTLEALFRKDRPTADQLLAAVKGVGYLYGTSLATALAVRNEQMFQLGQVAEERIGEMLQLSRSRGTTWHYEVADDDVREFWATLGEWYSVLGCTDLKQGKTGQAEGELLTAEALLDRKVRHGSQTNYLSWEPESLMFLGELYTEKGDYNKAEEYLSRSLSAGYSGSDEHPAIAAYRELYRREHNGSSEGLEQYLAKAYETDRSRRKGQILKTRLPEPKAVEPFKLTLLGSKKTVSLEELKGKFAVLNFWGTWCGPCRGELPELQKFYEKYKDTPNVVVLTIDHGDTQDAVANFMAEKKYGFPVLLDADYASKAGVNAFPTAWFVGPDGKRVFESHGSAHLVEEFTWRVEGMMEAVNAAEQKNDTKAR